MSDITLSKAVRSNLLNLQSTAGLLGKSGTEADAYAAAIVAAEFGKDGEEKVIDKLTADLAGKGVDRRRVVAELEQALVQAKAELGAPK